MSAEEASGAYLGGIGTMLEVADVCPTCGTAHSDRQYSFLHRGSGQCPALVEGSFAVVSRPPPSRVGHLVPDLAKAPTSEIPVSIGSLPLPPREEEVHRRNRALTLPYLPPPDLGGIF
ncbi:MAG TPA: hypothetical protein VEL82_08825 [Thermoplasmata archaeon]|nr:hypothetical protein [Thermoplasmata archaeon]